MPSPPKHLFTPLRSQTNSSPKIKEPDLKEKIWERDCQCKLDAAAARRLELQRVKEQLEAVCKEKLRLNSLATIKRGWEV